MFQYTKNFFVSTQHELRTYKDIWFPIFLYQIVARTGIVLSFTFGYLFTLDWIIKNDIAEGVFVTGFDTLELIHIERFAVAFILFLVLLLITALVETLGVYSISRQYYAGKRVSLRRTILEVSKLMIPYTKALTLKYLIEINIWIAGLIIAGIIYIFMPNILGIFFVCMIFCYTFYQYYQKKIDLTDVSQRVFERPSSIPAVFNYEILGERRIKIFKFHLFQTFFLGFFIVLFPTTQVFIIWLTTRFADLSLTLSSLLVSLNVIIGITIGALFSFIYVSFFILRGTRIYFDHKKKTSETRHEYKEKRYMKYKKPLLWSLALGYICSFFVLSFGIFHVFTPENKSLPLIIGHRASMVGHPENSLPALTYSIENGANYAEIDILLSKEGIPIVFHDPTYDDGTREKYIGNTPLEEIQKYDLITGQNITSEETGTKIPTLEEFLLAAKGKIKLNIELKIIENFEDTLVTETLALIHKYQMENEVLITSFDIDILERVHTQAPDIETGLIIAAYFGNILNLDDYDVEWIMMNDTFYDFYKNEVKKLHKKIGLWSYSTDFTGEIAFNNRLDGAIVDDPQILHDILETYTHSSPEDKFFTHIQNDFLSKKLSSFFY